MIKFKRNYFVYPFFIILILAVGAIGFIIGIKYEHQIDVNSYLAHLGPIRESDTNYKFIKPLLAYKIPSANDEPQFKPLLSDVSNLIEKKKINNDLLELDKGRWIGMNQDQKYSPASLMKVVIMIAYFKEADQDSGILDKSLTYTKSIDDLIVAPNTPSKLQIGNSYNVDELINDMIIDSDNGALYLLDRNIDTNFLQNVTTALNIPNFQDRYVISPRGYSFIFRILYNANYLSRDMSEKAFSIMAQTKFTDGLVAGLPNNITVAHKFGQYNEVNDQHQITSVELHDCGIIYYEPSPYFLCIMTRGDSIDKLKTVIKDTSSLIYKNISNMAI